MNLLFFLNSAALGVGLRSLDTVATLLPLFFPRVAFAVRSLSMQKTQEGESDET